MKRNFSISGMPDFSPVEKERREYILSKIKKQFSLFGFLEIQTSSMSKLQSKKDVNYSEDADKLIFNVLKSGNYFTKLKQKYIDNQDESVSKLLDIEDRDLTRQISDKSLRYDLTVPFAKYVAENQSKIVFPFKRYEIGSVWRADRPQRGRLREFTQCDADIIGDDSLWSEVDLIKLINVIFDDLGVENRVIKINNRKILEGIWEKAQNNSPNSFERFCVLIDKKDKIGIDKVCELLLEEGYGLDFILILKKLFLFNSDKTYLGPNNFRFKKEYLLKQIKSPGKSLLEGLDELSFLFEKITPKSILWNSFDMFLARGLDYYTGVIFEVVSFNDSNSLAGGGRYDNLTDRYGLNGVSGIGVSFGLDRLYLQMETLNLFKDINNNGLDFLFINFGENESTQAQNWIDQIREFGSKSAELYPSPFKLSKQMSYADKRNAKFVVIVGEDEMQSNTLTIKNMNTGEQQSVTGPEFIKSLKNDI